MNWNILEAYIVTLFEMINTNDINYWSAINKFESFIKDISNEFDIVKKEGKIK